MLVYTITIWTPLRPVAGAASPRACQWNLSLGACSADSAVTSSPFVGIPTRLPITKLSRGSLLFSLTCWLPLP